MSLFRSLSHRSFALLWSGQAISRVGDHLYQIALAWWVLEKTGSATAMGTVLIFSFTPMLLFSLVGGVVADRLPRLPVMLASDLLRGVVVGLVAVLAWGQHLEIWHVYVASLVFGLADAFFQPAYAATLPEMLPADALPSANALTSLSVQMGRVAGPALGALMVSLGGTASAFALNALSFFISAACLAPLSRALAAPRTPDHPPSSLLHDAREGIGTVLASPWLCLTIVMLALINVTLSGPYSVALPFLVKEHLHGDVKWLGVLYASFPIGYVLAGLWLGRATHLRRRGLLAYGGVITAGLMMLVLGLPVPWPVLLLAALINGAALEIFGLVWTNSLQQLVPRDKLGRVASLDALGSFALLPVGYAVAGWATDRIGAAPVCIIGGAATAVLAALGLAHPAIRNLD